MNRAVFLDKDGILNIDSDIMLNIIEPKIIDDAVLLLDELSSKGYLLFIITNQPVVARGLIKESELVIFLEDYKRKIEKKGKRIKIERIYYCPHHPNADLAEYRVNCKCRKPKPGMILDAAKEYKICLEKSYVIGDRISDVASGSFAGCKTIFCETGKHKDKIIESDLSVNYKLIKPDFRVKSISEVKDIIL